MKYTNQSHRVFALFGVLSCLASCSTVNARDDRQSRGARITSILTKQDQSNKPPTKFQARLVRYPNGDEIREGDRLRSGDRYRIEFTPSQNGYVYILQFDSSKKLSDLTEEAHFENRIQAGVSYIFPSGDGVIELDEKIGEETIHIIVSQVQQPELKREYQAMINGNEHSAANEAFKKAEDETATRGARVVSTNKNGSVTVKCKAENCQFIRQFKHD